MSTLLLVHNKTSFEQLKPVSIHTVFVLVVFPDLLRLERIFERDFLQLDLWKEDQNLTMSIENQRMGFLC